MTMQRALCLIKFKASGSPKEFAGNLGISERTLYRLIREMEEVYHLKIVFSYLHNSYVLKDSDDDQNILG